MRNSLSVIFELERLKCFEEADGWGSAEPYMWTVFFKIDGTTCRLNNSLMLEGSATIYTTPGSHGNLNNNDVDGGETVQIPSVIGYREMTLTPIPVPDFVKNMGTDDAPAVAGCIVVLMEEDNVSDDGAEAGHRALNQAIQNALDNLIPTLGAFNQEISDDDINNLTSQVQSRVEDAIKNQQNFFENLWSWLNKDDTIGTVVWKFSSDQLLDQNPISLRKRWKNGNGDWEIFGDINTAELPSCPAEVVKEIFDNLFGGDSSKKTMKYLYDFRKKEMSKFQGLKMWWSLASKNTHYLKAALQNEEIAQNAAALFKAIPDILNNRDLALNDEYFDNALSILKQISSINQKSHQSTKDVKRIIDALVLLKGRTPNQIFEILSSVRPARYPTMNNLGNGIAIRLKKEK